MMRKPVATTMTVIVACLLAASGAESARPLTSPTGAPTSLALSVGDIRDWVDVYDPQTPIFEAPGGTQTGTVTAGMYPTSRRDGDWHEIAAPQHGETVTAWVHSTYLA